MFKLEVFGKAVRTLRKEKGLTQAELARILHVTDKAVSKWEQGRGFPEISMLDELSEALGVSVVDLLEGNVNAHAQAPALALAPHTNEMQAIIDQFADARAAFQKKQRVLQRIKRAGILALGVLLLVFLMIHFIPVGPRVNQTMNGVVVDEDGKVLSKAAVLLEGRLCRFLFKGTFYAGTMEITFENKELFSSEEAQSEFYENPYRYAFLAREVDEAREGQTYLSGKASVDTRSALATYYKESDYHIVQTALYEPTPESIQLDIHMIGDFKRLTIYSEKFGYVLVSEDQDADLSLLFETLKKQEASKSLITQ